MSSFEASLIASIPMLLYLFHLWLMNQASTADIVAAVLTILMWCSISTIAVLIISIAIYWIIYL